MELQSTLDTLIFYKQPVYKQQGLKLNVCEKNDIRPTLLNKYDFNWHYLGLSVLTDRGRGIMIVWESWLGGRGGGRHDFLDMPPYPGQ